MQRTWACLTVSYKKCPYVSFLQDINSIAVATNSRSMIFVTIVSCVRWCVCVFDPIYSGASLRLSVYVSRISRGLKIIKRLRASASMEMSR